MRHQLKKRSSFGRHTGPRRALLRSLVSSLVEKERIKTTLSKAKSIQPLMEKAITIGKKGGVHAFRLLKARHPHKKTVQKIVKTLSPRFKDRAGGCTRIIKLGFREGDKAPLAYIEFVDFMPKLSEKKPEAGAEAPADGEKKRVFKDNKTRKIQERKVRKTRKVLRKIQKKSRVINR